MLNEKCGVSLTVPNLVLVLCARLCAIIRKCGVSLTVPNLVFVLCARLCGLMRNVELV